MLKIMQFTAPWCQACHQMDTVLAGLPGLQKIDLEQQPEAGAQYDIKSLPTVIIAEGAEILWRRSGLFPRTEIDEALKTYSRR